MDPGLGARGPLAFPTAFSSEPARISRRYTATRYFVVYDPDGYYAVIPAITTASPWKEKIRVSLIAAVYGGRSKFNSLGLFDDRDSIF